MVCEGPLCGSGNIYFIVDGKKTIKKRQRLRSFHLEAKSCFFARYRYLQKIFGSYNEAAKKVGLRPLYAEKLPKDFFTFTLPTNLRIAIDTREQSPLSFSFQTDAHKLDVGDYTLFGDHYSYTYVDRKSGSDLHATLSTQNYERFQRELQRVRNWILTYS